MTWDEILSGLQSGKVLRVDRKDNPHLPALLEHPKIANELVETADEQYIATYVSGGRRKTMSEQIQKCTTQNPMPKNAEGRWEHEGAECIGECSLGCCDYYRCKDCGTRWTQEVPE